MNGCAEVCGLSEQLQLMSVERDHWKSRYDATHNELNSARKVPPAHSLLTISAMTFLLDFATVVAYYAVIFVMNSYTRYTNIANQ